MIKHNTTHDDLINYASSLGTCAWCDTEMKFRWLVHLDTIGCVALIKTVESFQKQNKTRKFYNIGLT